MARRGVVVWIALGVGLGLWLGRGLRPSPPAPAESLSHTFREVARRVRPAVLSITTVRSIRPQDNPLGMILEGYFGRSERVERSSGTGFVVRPDGLALTSNHVVAGVSRVLARLHDGREVRARVVGTDALADLAVLQLEGPPPEGGWPAVDMGDASALEPGDWVLAVGNPFGLEQTVTAGIVSAKGRSRVGIAAYEDFIQTDVAINPGNSGGPLLALDGRVVGVATAIATRSGGYQGIGFAIPSDMARAIMDQIVQNGHVVRGWLGISLQDATPQLSERLGHGARPGALVSAVLPGGPAEAAGLQVGDLVIGVAGEAVTDAARLMNLVGRLPVGQPATVRVVRGGKELEVQVVTGERDLPQERVEAPPEPPRGVGITARALDAELIERFDYAPGAQGVVVVRVEPGSLAAEQGIRPGMILQQVDGHPVRNLEDLNAALKTIDLQRGVLLRVWDGSAAAFLLVQGAPQ